MKKKISPDFYFFVFLCLSISIHLIAPFIVIISYPYSLSGIILILTGLIVAYSANQLMLRNNTSIKPFELPNTLITSGVFRFSRNPVYLGMTLLLIGTGIILGSLSAFIIPFFFPILINRLIIPGEENTLEKEFGNDYLNYKTKVRRWL